MNTLTNLVICTALFFGLASGRAQDGALPESARVVVAIRYLQVTDVSHAHLFLYNGEGKLLRQLTNSRDGQDFDPVFARGGKSAVFRHETKSKSEFWRVVFDTGKLHRIDKVPDWYFAMLERSPNQFDFPASAPLKNIQPSWRALIG